MDISQYRRQSAFGYWLRTGQLPLVRTADGRELKFNPYHDPRNGRFTFAPGGPAISTASSQAVPGHGASGGQSAAFALAGPETEPARGSNIRAFEDPMTLEQAFPGLRNAPGGAIIAVADNALDLFGPGEAAQAELLQAQSTELIAQIKAIDPTWHYDEIGPTNAAGHPVESVQGLYSKVNDLRFQRAASLARVKGDYGPLKVETLRFVQRQTDLAYDQGLISLKLGRLKPRLSDQEALGNYVDRHVRMALRDRYSRLGIDSAGPGPVRVNRRESNTSGSETSYRRPDARVADIAFDVTLTGKTLRTPQVRGFFDADFRPSRVIIIRPSQLGGAYTYAINRPGAPR